MQVKKPEIVIIDDDDLVRERISGLLHLHGFSEVNAVSEPQEVKRLFRRGKVDILICDIMLAKNQNGIELVTELRGVYDFILVFISGSRHEVFEKTLPLKPDAYLVKPFSDRQIVTTISMVWTNKQPVMREQGRPDEDLSERESEVLGLLCRGMSSQAIADALGISIYTARTHRNRMMKKLEVNSIQQLLAKARELGY